jgi:hypothetical protein
MLAVVAGSTAILFTPTAASAAYYDAETDYTESSGGPTGNYNNNLNARDWGICNKNFGDDITMSVRAARYNSGNLVDRGPWVAMRT